MLLIPNSFESKLLCLNGKKCIRRSYRKMNLRNKQKKEAKRKKEMLEASTGIVKAEKRTRCKMNQLCIPGKTNGLSMHIHILGRNKGRQTL